MHLNMNLKKGRYRRSVKKMLAGEAAHGQKPDIIFRTGPHVSLRDVASPGQYIIVRKKDFH